MQDPNAPAWTVVADCDTSVLSFFGLFVGLLAFDQPICLLTDHAFFRIGNAVNELADEYDDDEEESAGTRFGGQPTRRAKASGTASHHKRSLLQVEGREEAVESEEEEDGYQLATPSARLATSSSYTTYAPRQATSAFRPIALQPHREYDTATVGQNSHAPPAQAVHASSTASNNGTSNQQTGAHTEVLSGGNATNSTVPSGIQPTSNDSGRKETRIGTTDVV